MTVVVRSIPKTVVIRSGAAGAPGAKGDPGSPGEGYATRSAMAARSSPALLDDVYLSEKGREGKFVVDNASSWTAQIAADTAQGLFVVSTADATKVYRRVYDGAMNVKWFGAKCDATASDWTNPATVTGTNDISAINAAIATCPNGGDILVPAHATCAGQINLDSKWNVRLVGIAGNGAGYHDPPPAQLIYTGTGSSPFISAAHTNGIAIENLGIRHTSSSFTGDLIALTNTTAGADAAFALVQRCLIGGIGVHTARSCISLEGAILSSIIDNHLQWAVTGIRGQKEISVGNVLYSNAIVVERNTFDNLTTCGILNPGQAWSINGNFFEGTDGGSGGMPKALYSDISAASGAGTGSITFNGNWLGDASAVTDSWVDFNHLFVSGLQMSGNFFNVLNASLYSAAKFPTKLEGGNISGNYINSFIDFVGTQDHFGVVCSGNFWTSDPANLSSGSADIWFIGNKKDSGFSQTLIRVANPGELQFGGNGSFSTVYGELKGLKDERMIPLTVATLPTGTPGLRAVVSDSTVAGSGNFGAAVVGGGSHTVPVYYDDTSNWRIG